MTCDEYLQHEFQPFDETIDSHTYSDAIWIPNNKHLRTLYDIQVKTLNYYYQFETTTIKDIDC